jgi:hypothetical protein
VPPHPTAILWSGFCQNSLKNQTTHAQPKEPVRQRNGSMHRWSPMKELNAQSKEPYRNNFNEVHLACTVLYFGAAVNIILLVLWIRRFRN